MDERRGKWERVLDLFEERGILCNRFSAINGWKLTKKQKEELTGPYSRDVRGGRLGCLLSHVSVIKDAFDRGLEVIWICEDDVEFINDEKKIPELIATLSEIDPDWDILYTDRDMKDCAGKPLQAVSCDFRPDQQHFPIEYYWERIRIHSDLIQIRQRYGTHSYIVSRQGMKKIIDYFTHVYLWTAVDIDIHYVPGIREYAPINEIVSNWWRCPISDTNSMPK